MKKFSCTVCMLFFSLFLSVSCKDERRACLNPPPSLLFKVLDANNEPLITASNSGTVKISYLKAGSKNYVSNLRVLNSPENSNQYLVENYDIIQVAKGSNATIFTLEIDQQPVGEIQLKTYQKDTDCDNWEHVSEASFNGKVITRNESGHYMFKI